MPELPEVETVRIGLEKYLPGLTIEAVNFDWPKSFPNDEVLVRRNLIGAKITDVRRRAKVLIVDLSTNFSLIIHLKMTGQLVFRAELGERFDAGHPSDSLVGRLPDKSTGVEIDLAHSGGNRAKLFFNDQRKFGWMRLVPTLEIANLDFFKKAGPEPLGPEFQLENFKKAVSRRPRSSIKAVLLDQSIVAGIGNIYADEALYNAKIHPATPAGKLGSQKLARLFDAIKIVLQISLDAGGSTDRNYVDADGNRGSYLKFAGVFRRNGELCGACGATIEKIRVAGRGTHICPRCQKID